MSKIVRLVRNKPSRAAIALLKQILDETRKGEVMAIGLVTVKRGKVVGTCFIGADDGFYHELNSGAGVLARRLNNHGE